jgi:hypothetical protein
VDTLDDVVVFAAVFVFVLQLYGLYMVSRMRRMLDGAPGAYLLKIVYRFGVAVAFSQLLTILNMVLRNVDNGGTYDVRTGILLVMNGIITVAFLWTVWEIHHTPVITNEP